MCPVADAVAYRFASDAHSSPRVARLPDSYKPRTRRKQTLAQDTSTSPQGLVNPILRIKDAETSNQRCRTGSARYPDRELEDARHGSLLRL